jgi:oligoribonuclease (3'-5' exoribonuclease)
MTTPSTAPLVWIDCEMSGLRSDDVLLQVACYVTTHNMELLDDTGINITISRPRAVLDGMDEWCTRTHASTGLTEAVLASTTSVEEAEHRVLEYIQRFVPEKRVGLLAGNTVHADKEFLKREMPRIVDWLHYRILDVSAIKEAARRWCSEEVLKGVPVKKGLHEAGEDIRESIEEAKYWRDVLFTPAKPKVEGGK